MQPAPAGVVPSRLPRVQAVDLSPHLVQMSGNRSDGGGGPRASESGTHPAVAEGAVGFVEAEALLQGVGTPEAGLRAFLNTLPVAATASRLIGKEHRLQAVAANAAFLQLFGRSERELAKKPLADFLSLGSAPLAPFRLWTIVRSGVFKAERVDFQGRQGPQKIWASGLVRGVYGEDFAFTFYQPRGEGQTRPPPVPSILKAFQSVDGTRRLDMDAEGYLELRSSLELGLQVSNPDSPLMRALRYGDLRLRLTDFEPTPITALGPALERGLDHADKRIPFPPGRSLLLEQSARIGQADDTVHWINRVDGFSRSFARPLETPPLVSAVTPNASATGRDSSSQPSIQPGTLFEQVSKSLEGIISPERGAESEGRDPRKPSRK